MAGFTRLDLDNKILELLGIDSITPMIDKQISRFTRERGYTFLEIARALAYHCITSDTPLDPKYGIAIVPYVMEDAKKYFKAEAARTQAQIRQAEDYKNSGKNNDIICKQKIKKSNRVKPFIDIGAIKEDD